MVIGCVLQAAKVAVAYLWPGYLTYKALQYGDTAVQCKWTVYWCVLGFLAGLEYACDLILFWLPLYRVAKILFALYLWHPQTNGAWLIYNNVLVGYLKQREAEIDAAAEDTQAWLKEKTALWRDQALLTLGRGAVLALEKAQEIGSPRTPSQPQSPRIPAFVESSEPNSPKDD